MKKIDTFLANSFIVLLSLVLSFSLCELVARIFFPDEKNLVDSLSYDSEKRPWPYTMFGGKPYTNGANHLGYRGPVPPLVKAKGVKRIFVLGGSTIYSGTPSIPQALSELFLQQPSRHPSRPVEIYNYGISSAKSGEELARILYEVVDYSPDLIIIYDGGNDLGENCGDPRPGYPFNFLVYEKNPIMEKNVGKYPLIPLIMYGSLIFRYLLRDYFANKFVGLDQLREDVYFKSIRWAKKNTENYLKNLRKIQRLSTAFDFQLLIFFQPMKVYQNYFIKTGHDYCPSASHCLLDPVLHSRHEILQQVKSPAFKDLPFIDLTTLFNHFPAKVFVDPIHVHDQYNKVVAEHIFPYAQRIINP